jgi:hypothetical protein
LPKLSVVPEHDCAPTVNVIGFEASGADVAVS